MELLIAGVVVVLALAGVATFLLYRKGVSVPSDNPSGVVVTQGSEEAKQVLARVSESMAVRFPNAHARQAQLNSHLATVAMVIDHLFEEDGK